MGSRPQLLNLKQALEVFIGHRKDVITRRTVFELRKAEERLHILDGLKIALDNLDAVIALIRAANDPATARAQLVERFSLSEIQAQAILDMRLQRLTGLERDKILEEREEVLKKIARYKEILADESEVYKIIVEESLEIKKLHADPRRTEIVDATTEISIEDLIVEEDMVVTLSHEGYIKRNAVNQYRAQRRGGRGKIGATTKEADFVEHVFVASTHAYILFFTTSGRVYWRKVHEIPQAGRAARGRSVTNLLSLGPDERLSAFLPLREFQEGGYILFATRRGLVKKTDIMQYSNPRPSGIIAISLEEGDELIGVRLTDGPGRRHSVDVQRSVDPFQRNRRAGDGPFDLRGRRHAPRQGSTRWFRWTWPSPVRRCLPSPNAGTASEPMSTSTASRGAAAKASSRCESSKRTALWFVSVESPDDEDIMLITDAGKLIRTPVAGISVMGRATQGVRLIDLNKGEKVVGVARLAEKEDEDVIRPAPDPTS